MHFQNKQEEIWWQMHTFNTDLNLLLRNLKEFAEDRKEAVAQLQEAKEKLNNTILELQK